MFKINEILKKKKLKTCFIKKDYIDQIDEQKILEKKENYLNQIKEIALQNAIKENYRK